MKMIFRHFQYDVDNQQQNLLFPPFKKQQIFQKQISTLVPNHAAFSNKIHSSLSGNNPLLHMRPSLPASLQIHRRPWK